MKRPQFKSKVLLALTGLFTGVILLTVGTLQRPTSAAPNPAAVVTGVQAIATAAPAAEIATGWTTVANAKTATTGYLNPASATGVTAFSMSRSFQTAFEGGQFRLRYLHGATITTPCVLRPWQVNGSDYQSLSDANGNIEISLTSAATDQDDGTYCYSESCASIDARGGANVLPTIKTAAVSSSGAVDLQWRPY